MTPIAPTRGHPILRILEDTEVEKRRACVQHARSCGSDPDVVRERAKFVVAKPSPRSADQRRARQDRLDDLLNDSLHSLDRPPVGRGQAWGR